MPFTTLSSIACPVVDSAALPTMTISGDTLSTLACVLPLTSFVIEIVAILPLAVQRKGVKLAGLRSHRRLFGCRGHFNEYGFIQVRTHQHFRPLHPAPILGFHVIAEDEHVRIDR